MTWRNGAVAGPAARIARISFSGELAYEVNVASWYGQAMWEAVMAAGEPFGIMPYGTEASASCVPSYTSSGRTPTAR